MSEPVCPIDQSANCKLLKEIHSALIGNPLDPNAPPGVVTMVERHNYTLYGNRDGKTGKDGLVGESQRYKKLVWMGLGGLAVLVFLGKVFDFLLAMKSVHQP